MTANLVVTFHQSSPSPLWGGIKGGGAARGAPRNRCPSHLPPDLPQPADLVIFRLLSLCPPAYSNFFTQAETSSPLLMSPWKIPSIMKLGDTWTPFCRA